MLHADAIAAMPQRECYLCGSMGLPTYAELRDPLFDAPGFWNVKRCPEPRCGLMWLDPMPRQEEVGKAYQRYYTHGSAASPRAGVGRRLYEYIREGYLSGRYGYPGGSLQRAAGNLIYLHPAARAHADFAVLYQRAPGPRTRLLDVGCGDGGMLDRLRHRGWRDLHGVDVDAQAVSQARARGLLVKHGTLIDQHYPDGSFDVIAMSHVLEHVHDPVGLLKECRRVLRPGGRLLVATPNAQSWGHRLYGADWYHLDPPRHLYLFNLRNLRTLFARISGLRVTAVRSTIRGAGLTVTMSRWIRRVRRTASAQTTTPSDQILGHFFYYAEWLAMMASPALGEEAIVLAQTAD
jgi:2-polyprenyl-3-methyl-5-hydroxy-6-metoxy-1,4-benzoquinol methylase